MRGPGNETEGVLRDAREVDPVGLRPEELTLPERRRVDGAGLRGAHAERGKPGAHFAGGARGEGDGERACRVVATLTHRVGDPVRDRPRLARPCPGKDNDRMLKHRGHASLFRVEGIEYLVAHTFHCRCAH